jgi:hypothetical protein
MDVSTFGSISHRVPILDGVSYNSWRIEMLSIFRVYNLRKYVETPYVPLFDPLHPTMDEELYLLRNLRTVHLIIRGLPDNLLELVINFECAYSMWKFLEELYPDYSLRGLDEILHKTIEFDMMCPNDPNFDKCFFELRNLMRKKGNPGLINVLIRNALICIPMIIVTLTKLMQIVIKLT